MSDSYPFSRTLAAKRAALHSHACPDMVGAHHVTLDENAYNTVFSQSKRATGLEPATFGLGSRHPQSRAVPDSADSTRGSIPREARSWGSWRGWSSISHERPVLAGTRRAARNAADPTVVPHVVTPGAEA